MKIELDVVNHDGQNFFRHQEAGKGDLFFSSLPAYTEFVEGTLSIHDDFGQATGAAWIDFPDRRSEDVAFVGLGKSFFENAQGCGPKLDAIKGFKPGDTLTLDLPLEGIGSFHDYLIGCHRMTAAFTFADPASPTLETVGEIYEFISTFPEPVILHLKVQPS